MLNVEHLLKCTSEMYPRVPLFRFINTPLVISQTENLVRCETINSE